MYPDDEARRFYFLGRLREHLLDLAVQPIDGFPVGQVEDIRTLSDPPYFTACPNPLREKGLFP